MRLRAATPADVPALAALEHLLFGADAWSESAVASDLDAPGRLVLVGERDDAVVGYAVTALSGEVADLQRIAVAPDHQRTGVAAALLAQAVSTAQQEGAGRMLLEVSTTNTAALGLYAAAGFTAIDRRRRYYRDATDAVVMCRPLTTDIDAERG